MYVTALPCATLVGDALIATDTSDPDTEVTVAVAVLFARSLSGIADASALVAAALNDAVTAPATLATAWMVRLADAEPLARLPERVQVIEPELRG